MKIKLNYPMVDYITMTFEADSPIRSGIALLDDIEGMREIMAEGEPAKVRWFVGKRKDGIFVGSGWNNGKFYAMLDAPGAIADSVFQECAMLNVKPGSCTRIDVQVTTIRREGLELVDAHLELQETEKRKVKIEGNRADGYTLYIGAPSSDKRIRIYDKSVMVNGFRNVFWRFEVQYRRELAEQVYNSLAYGGYEPCQFLKGEVEAIERRPNTVASKILKDFWYVLGSGSGLRPTTIHYESNTFEWMRKQVEPAIVNMLNSHDYTDRLAMVKLLHEWFVMCEYSVESMSKLVDAPND